MATLQELMQQKAALDTQIKATRERERAEVLARVRAMVAEYRLTRRDVFPAARRGGAKMPPKYRDPATGKTWSGQGKAPLWIANQDRSRFLI